MGALPVPPAPLVTERKDLRDFSPRTSRTVEHLRCAVELEFYRHYEGGPFTNVHRAPPVQPPPPQSPENSACLQHGRKPWRSGKKAPKLTVKFPQPARGIPLSQRQKIEVLLPPQHTASLNTLRGVRREMCRVYRGVANGRISSDEATRRIYILKEIRAALEAEILTDVQQRLVLLSRDMDNHNGQRVPYQPALTGG